MIEKCFVICSSRNRRKLLDELRVRGVVYCCVTPFLYSFTAFATHIRCSFNCTIHINDVLK